jgi:predicted nucleotidyltransferase
MRRSEVITKLKDHSNFLVEEYGVKALFLFGSVARDEASKDSDVDLFVEFNNPIGLFEFVSLKHELETLLGCQVDLGTKRSLKREIKETIEGETIRVT